MDDFIMVRSSSRHAASDDIGDRDSIESADDRGSSGGMARRPLSTMSGHRSEPSATRRLMSWRRSNGLNRSAASRDSMREARLPTGHAMSENLSGIKLMLRSTGRALSVKRSRPQGSPPQQQQQRTMFETTAVPMDHQGGGWASSDNPMFVKSGA